ncbi:MAG: hypothetical protein EPN30_10705 [Actinomycetota bacterium]|nr:MAG: hypothetical protein EPN30_10705 [Actinomycetota bacterium]
MTRYVLRIWLDDRPGALGSVASRIGSVKGDLVGIEILERGAGRVIDELIVDLPNDEFVDLMVREVQEVDGVDVENVSVEPNPDRDSRLDPVLTAAAIVEQESRSGLLEELVDRLSFDFTTRWVVAFDMTENAVIAFRGNAPLRGWVEAYFRGVSSGSAYERTEPSDIALMIMPQSNVAVLMGRPDRPFRDLERSQLDALARIGDVMLESFTD